jgi:hypothetical protein
MTIAPEKLTEAKRLRALKVPIGWRQIVVLLGESEYRLRCELEPGFKDHRRAINLAADRRKHLRATGDRLVAVGRLPGENEASTNCIHHRSGNVVSMALQIPRDVLIDRDMRALLDHPTFTAAHCGDPKPGYSALDQTAGRRPLYERLKA